VKRISLVVAILPLLFACNHHSETKTPRGISFQTVDTSSFDLLKYRSAAKRIIILDSIPGTYRDYTEAEKQARRFNDRETFERAWQDSTAEFFVGRSGYWDPDNGIYYHAFISYPEFDLVCFKTLFAEGFSYDLITYTKNGKRIDHLLAAYYPGVVKIGELGIKNNDLQSSTIKTDTIQKIEAVCDWLGDKRGYICDTIFTNYKLSADGKFVLVNSDTILNSQLNATRKMRLD